MNKKMVIGIGVTVLALLTFVGVRAAIKKNEQPKSKKKLKPVIEVPPLQKISEQEYERGLLKPSTTGIKLVDMTIVKSPASTLGAKKIKLV